MPGDSNYNGWQALDQVALNAASGSRTVDINLENIHKTGRLQCNLTRVAATDLQLTLYGSLDGTNFGGVALKVESGAQADLDNEPLVLIKTVSGNDILISPVLDLECLQSLRVVVSGTSGGASDLVDLFFTARG